MFADKGRSEASSESSLMQKQMRRQEGADSPVPHSDVCECLRVPHLCVSQCFFLSIVVVSPHPSIRVFIQMTQQRCCQNQLTTSPAAPSVITGSISFPVLLPVRIVHTEVSLLRNAKVHHCGLCFPTPVPQQAAPEESSWHPNTKTLSETSCLLTWQHITGGGE
ncbi:unnamed protein product [Pleuronectes platessa]|uniref:Uncharacterized protein n=1 Tax=Pleuronectes platessa TaxID=8262 RepID=A0A9N7UWY8_PLEPL|nr:unnamed protein product [Pleuronectes platessa]